MNKEHYVNIRVAIIYWLVTFGYMGIIYFLSSQQSFHIHGIPENFDKAVHMLLYIPLAFMLYLSLNRSGLKKSLFIAAFIFAGIYGITDEFHQYFVPGRHSSAGDVAADFIGAFLGSTGAKHFVRINNKSQTSNSKKSDDRQTTNVG